MANNSGAIRDPEQGVYVLFHLAPGVGSGRGITEPGSPLVGSASSPGELHLVLILP